MRSFAVVASFAAAANAYAQGYGYEAPANMTSSAMAEYPVSSPPAGYPVASSSAPSYEAVSSKVPEHPVYTTKIVTGLTTVCPEPTTVTYGTKTYVVKTSTTIVDEDCEYTTTYAVGPTPTPAMPTHDAPSAPPANTHYAPPAHSQGPPAPPAHVPYPSAGNGTVPHPTGAQPSASVTKPSTPEFTGAAAQAGVGLLAVIGAVAAFL